MPFVPENRRQNPALAEPLPTNGGQKKPDGDGFAAQAASMSPLAQPDFAGQAASLTPGRSQQLGELATEIGAGMGLSSADIALRCDDGAAAKAGSVGAPAVVDGNVINIDQAKVDPNTAKGKEVVCHEVAHIGQRKMGTQKASHLESEAEAATIATRFAEGGPLAAPTMGLDAQMAAYRPLDAELKTKFAESFERSAGNPSEDGGRAANMARKGTKLAWGWAKDAKLEEEKEEEGWWGRMKNIGTQVAVRGLAQIASWLDIVPLEMERADMMGAGHLMLGADCNWQGVDFYGALQMQLLGRQLNIGQPGARDRNQAVWANIPWFSNEVNGQLPEMALEGIGAIGGGHFTQEMIQLAWLQLQLPDINGLQWTPQIPSVRLHDLQIGGGGGLQMGGFSLNPQMVSLMVGQYGGIEQMTAAAGSGTMSDELAMNFEAQRVWMHLFGRTMDLGAVGLQYHERNGIRGSIANLPLPEMFGVQPTLRDIVISQRGFRIGSAGVGFGVDAGAIERLMPDERIMDILFPGAGDQINFDVTISSIGIDGNGPRLGSISVYCRELGAGVGVKDATAFAQGLAEGRFDVSLLKFDDFIRNALPQIGRRAAGTGLDVLGDVLEGEIDKRTGGNGLGGVVNDVLDGLGGGIAGRPQQERGQRQERRREQQPRRRRRQSAGDVLNDVGGRILGGLFGN